uniref:Photosynthesis system II assembly factor Ycf48/Hcf136-like domain-containing protein n=1 Tax=Attheya septentrionalis TaxID=420275 RepID=A0A7S2UBA7_9STRA|mmetsp:Transcript_18377/g.33312  ORF Transcript_18377/g.33312 Transcript_18377/m.33312 type:complete len:408 (+) Transcript_18377:172-1395(+)
MKFTIASALFVLSSASCSAFVQQASRACSSTSTLSMSAADSGSEGRRTFVTKTGSAAAMASLATVTGSAGLPQPAEAAASKMWKQIQLPFEDTLYDVDFDSPTHGYLVGARGAFAETNDGGNTWEARSFSNLDAEEEVTYRFQVVSFQDGEGWVLGKPTLMLHTKDSGKTWERIPLSPKLPGEPTSILAKGPGKAEMTTSSGAVYVTENAGRNWKAQVKETIDATLNRISSSGVSGASYFSGSIINQVRDDEGAYLAVSSRGNFFLTWEPGQDFWIPHNRGQSRRIQSMGFVEGDIHKGLWMTLNGGKLLVANKDIDLKKDDFPFVEADIKTGGYGITDVAWRNTDEVWAVGGSNTMYVSFDGGKSFKFDKSANNIPGNLYNVKFFKQFSNAGWAVGSNGLLLKYIG